LGGVSLRNSLVENRGLQFDRRWLLVNEKNEFLTQRNFPEMATIKVEIADNTLCVSCQSASLAIPFQPETKETVSVKIWQSRCRAQVYEDQINRWFENVLQTKCRLVLMPAETKRKVNYFYAVHKDDIVSFADGYPFLVIGDNSLAELNSKLEKPVPMNRFRPNFVVSGSNAFAEDDWKKVKIGNVIFHVVKPCARCVVTTVNQETGVFDGKEPLKTLASFRTPKRSIKKKILFGQHLIAENTGEILNVGDKIEVIEYLTRKRIFNIKF
ncbi:MAG TPA: MOSC domain-containing protein, partial [Pyrinomonadaceae bacterium]|nr:MOSC domain-containing protein [Pyrinomonadaceae bacterium]